MAKSLLENTPVLFTEVRWLIMAQTPNLSFLKVFCLKFILKLGCFFFSLSKDLSKEQTFALKTFLLFQLIMIGGDGVRRGLGEPFFLLQCFFFSAGINFSLEK